MSRLATRNGAKKAKRGRSEPGGDWPLAFWYGAMVVGGLGFGLLADRRPFGEAVLVHPLVMFFILVGLGLIALRVVLARPVPSVISDRALLLGCLIGLLAFLAGNLLAVYLLA